MADEEEQDVEEAFEEAGKRAKVRLKDLKALNSIMQALASQAVAHAKAMEKLGNAAEGNAQLLRKEGKGTVSTPATPAPETAPDDMWWSHLSSTIMQVRPSLRPWAAAQPHCWSTRTACVLHCLESVSDLVKRGAGSD